MQTVLHKIWKQLVFSDLDLTVLKGYGQLAFTDLDKMFSQGLDKTGY